MTNHFVSRPLTRFVPLALAFALTACGSQAPAQEPVEVKNTLPQADHPAPSPTPDTKPEEPPKPEKPKVVQLPTDCALMNSEMQRVKSFCVVYEIVVIPSRFTAGYAAIAAGCSLSSFS